MRILVLGADGYLGWPTAMHFSAQGHTVGVVDNMVKRFWEAQVGVEPLFKTSSLNERVRTWKQITGKEIDVYIGDISENGRFVYNTVREFAPDTIIHFAEQPSAPFSMIGRSNCIETQRNNVLGTLNLMFAIESLNPDIHLVKLGTMGEYGTPNIDIEEGWLEVNHNGRKERMLYPKKPPSFYHLSKVHDSANLEFGCRSWGMRVTDLNQGIVYGIETPQTAMDEKLATSFHYDSVFGTVLNRFIVQAVLGIDLTVYGSGGQTRGFLNINDTLRCVEIAAENPAEHGEFRVFNQFTETFSVRYLAELVAKVARSKGFEVKIGSYHNPRTEAEEHYFNAKNSGLKSLGLDPIVLTEDVVGRMIDLVEKKKDKVDTTVIQSVVDWKIKTK